MYLCPNINISIICVWCLDSLIIAELQWCICPSHTKHSKGCESPCRLSPTFCPQWKLAREVENQWRVATGWQYRARKELKTLSITITVVSIFLFRIAVLEISTCTTHICIISIYLCYLVMVVQNNHHLWTWSSWAILTQGIKCSFDSPVSKMVQSHSGFLRFPSLRTILVDRLPNNRLIPCDFHKFVDPTWHRIYD